MPTFKVEINCESVEEFIEIFSPLVSNKQIVVEAVVQPTTKPTETTQPVKEETEPTPELKEPKAKSATCKKCDAALVSGENWYASHEKSSNYTCSDCHKQYQNERNKKKRATKRAGKAPKTGRPRTRTCTSCNTMETPQWRMHKGKQVCNACKMRALREEKKGKETSAEKPEETKVKKTEKPARRFRKVTVPKKGRKGKAKPKPTKPKEQPKTRSVNAMFSAAYDALSSAISTNNTADTNSVLEAMSVIEKEKEMATEIVIKLMRAAGGHSVNDFAFAEGKNPTLLCFSAGAELPALNILRAY